MNNGGENAAAVTEASGLLAEAQNSPGESAGTETAVPSDTNTPKDAEAEKKGETSNSGKPETESAGKPDAKSEIKAEPEKDNEKDNEKDDGLAKAWENFGAGLDSASGVDKNILNSFAETARKLGLAPDQAQKLVDWQLDVFKKTAEKMRSDGLEFLKKEWGDQTSAKIGRALEALTIIDRQFPNGEFSKAVGKFGIANDPVFIQGLEFIARQMDEDSLAASHNPGGPVNKPESPLDGIVNAMKALKH